MSIRALDHVNIRTPQIQSTVAFFRDVLGMTVTAPPGAPPGSRAAWVLDDAGKAVVHIGDAETPYPTDADVPFAASRGSGSVHHVAFNCEGLAAMRERLVCGGIEATENHIAQIGLLQLFVREPNGILLELNFWEVGQGNY